MGLVARALEARGIPTIYLAALRRPAQLVRAPRTLFTGNSNSQIVGAPGDRDAQRGVLRRALRLLTEATEPGTFVELAPPA
ncbi:MAG TPA: hypothetical protein VGN32_15210 [Ktedonobacterales bacterium]|nr:hypothetical protein [Ktedonobacterales bacterium]